MKTFFTADLHLFDDIYPYRRFKDSREYVEMLTRRWNDTVGSNDMVFILGDISKGEDEVNSYVAVKWIQSHLNGHKVLIPGNHDTYAMCTQFAAGNRCYVRKMAETIRINDKIFLLTHMPAHPDELKFYTGNIHGHIHRPIPEIGYTPISWPNPQRDVMDEWLRYHSYYNVNVEFHDWAPVSEESVKIWFNI